MESIQKILNLTDLFFRASLSRNSAGSPSNWRSRGKLEDFLAKYGVVGIQGIDTRALTRHIRGAGAQQAVLSTRKIDPRKLVEQARKSPGLEGKDLVKKVSCHEPYDWNEGEWELSNGKATCRSAPAKPGKSNFVVAYDFGIKRNILRLLIQAGCRVKSEIPNSGILHLLPRRHVDHVWLQLLEMTNAQNVPR